MAVRREVEIRTSCSMSQVVALPLVCSLGAADAVPNSLVRWPSGLVRADGSTCVEDVLVSVRYEGGIVARVSFGLDESLCDRGEDIERSMLGRVEEWQGSITPKVAPLAPVLNELFDRLWLMGQPVEALLPDGQAFASGMLAGIDLWGRVTVLVGGRELELAPEQATLRPLP